MFWTFVVISGPVISEEYSLEYGTDKIEMHVGAVQEGERALVIDDLIATGGTLCAAISLLGNVLLQTPSLGQVHYSLEMIFACYLLILLLNSFQSGLESR